MKMLAAPLFCVLLGFLSSACTATSRDEPGACHFTPEDMLRAVASDPRLSSYGAGSWNAAPVTILWDGYPSPFPSCATDPAGLMFVRSSSVFDRARPFVAVEKLYFDENAAFIELGFPPTGKNADVFMRKEAGAWRVKQTHLWEN